MLTSSPVTKSELKHLADMSVLKFKNLTVNHSLGSVVVTCTLEVITSMVDKSLAL